MKKSLFTLAFLAFAFIQSFAGPIIVVYEVKNGVRWRVTYIDGREVRRVPDGYRG